MTQDCASELLIDRLIAGELAPAAEARVRGHAASCAECGDLLGRAEAAAQRFAVARPPLRLPMPRTARIAVASAAVAAAVALVVVAPWRSGPRGAIISPAPTIATKGEPSLGLFVSHGGELRRGQRGEIVAPGDQLQPVTTAEGPGWIALTAVDGAGLYTVYAAPQPLLAGRDRPLPFSILLDGTRGPTTLTAVFCPQLFALEPRSREDRDDERARQRAALPDGCTRDAITIEIR